MTGSPSMIKLGGNVLGARGQMDAIWSGVKAARAKGEAPIIVHGAGPQISALTRLQGGEPRQIHGRRVTDGNALRALMWSGRGELNSRLVAAGHAAGIRAVGISGVDAGTIQVSKRPPWEIDGESVDFQWVGDVERVDTELLYALIERGVVPVVAPLGIDSQGEIFNVNADTVALAIGAALKAASLVMITGGGGVRESDQPGAALIESLSRDQIREGVDQGWITEGMRVKLDIAVSALESGIAGVRVGGIECLVHGGGTQIRL